MNDIGTVTVRREETEAGTIARLTLSHEAKRNAVSPGVIRGLTTAAAELTGDPDIRIVIVEGAGTRAFSAGADVRVLAGLDPEGARTFITSLHEAINAVRRLPVPVIAALRGYCFGAAMELAAACDMRIADTTLLAGMPEVRVGIPSVIEACLLPRLIGWGRTSELLLTGRNIDAEEALRIGFVERITSPETLDEALGEWIDMILGCGPAAIRSQKSVMQAWETDERTSISASIDAFAAAYQTDEPARALTALTRR